jgi:hypothetical protein
MTQVLIRGEVRETLASLSETSELWNEQGELVGVFTPANLIPHPRFVELTDEELQRRRGQKATRTLSEIWTSLGVTR